MPLINSWQGPSNRLRRHIWIKAIVLAAAGMCLAQPVDPPAAGQPIDEMETAGVTQKPGGEAAGEDEISGDDSLATYFATTPQLTGDWFGLRRSLEEAGFMFSFEFGSGFQINMRGGENTHNAHDISGTLNYSLIVDLEKVVGLEGGEFFARASQSWNPGIDDDVGSLADPGDGLGGADDAFTLDKWWWRQRLFDDRLEFQLGKLEANGDLVDANAYADNNLTQFMNGALLATQNVPGTVGLGAAVQIWPTDWMYMVATVIDPDYDDTDVSHGFGGFDTAFHGEDRPRTYWEFGILPQYIDWGTEQEILPGTYRFGWWLDSKSKQVFRLDRDGEEVEIERSGDVGWYLSFDQMVWKENADPKDEQGIGLFCRYGYAPEDVNLIEHYWGLGAAWRGPIPERDADVLGFGVAQSILSDQYRRKVDGLADRETVYEVYYEMQLAPWVAITPSVQMITNPGGLEDARDAWVAGLRVRMDF